MSAKDEAGKKKVQLQLVPPGAIAASSVACEEGAKKYGAYDWRSNPIEAMQYIGAAKRHLDAWQDGENVAPDSGINHLSHAMASIAILIDALQCGTCVDDRPPKGRAGPYHEVEKLE